MFDAVLLTELTGTGNTTSLSRETVTLDQYGEATINPPASVEIMTAAGNATFHRSNRGAREHFVRLESGKAGDTLTINYEVSDPIKPSVSVPFSVLASRPHGEGVTVALIKTERITGAQGQALIADPNVVPLHWTRYSDDADGNRMIQHENEDEVMPNAGLRKVINFMVARGLLSRDISKHIKNNLTRKEIHERLEHFLKAADILEPAPQSVPTVGSTLN